MFVALSEVAWKVYEIRAVKEANMRRTNGEPSRTIIGQDLMLVWWENISWVELANSEVVLVKIYLNNERIF